MKELIIKMRILLALEVEFQTEYEIDSSGLLAIVIECSQILGNNTFYIKINGHK